MQWPQLIQMRQRLDGAHIADLESCLRDQLRARLSASNAVPGQSVAIGVGSRGVSPIVEVVRTIVSEMGRAGLEPFIVPAMGSHGGATAAGQEAVLAEYGITLDSVGAPVRATMDVVELGRGPSGQTFFGDANAYNADHVVVIGRVKPHTDFKGEIESGLCKMTSVGLGKQIGAERIHETGLAETIPEGAQVAIDYGRLLLGVALVENAYDQPAHCEVVSPDEFHATDRRLLIAAKRLLPRLPIDQLQLLVVDEMGKNISGAGMDTNVVGLWRLQSFGEKLPDYHYLATLRLTEESGGNATGIGMADFVSGKLVKAMDPDQTYINGTTSLVVSGSRIPMNFPTDAETLEVAVGAASRLANRGTPRMARIRNTMELEEFWVSEPVADQLETEGRAERTGSSERFTFDDAGDLVGVAS